MPFLDRHLAKPATRAVAASTLGACLGVLPMYLIGALAPLIARDIQFEEMHVGMAIGGFSAAVAVAAAFGGRVVQRLGAALSMSLGSGALGLCLLGQALAPSSGAVIAIAVVTGTVSPLCMLGANLRLTRDVRDARLGLAYGIKQAAIPGATLVAGLSVPSLAVFVGWRAVFAIAGCGALLFATTVWQRGSPDRGIAGPDRRVRLQRRADLIRLSAAYGFGGAAMSTLGAFLVSYGAHLRVDERPAGLVLAGASLATIAMRLFLGRRVDRSGGDPLGPVVGLLTLGASGTIVLAHTSGPVAFAVVSIVAFTAAWSWAGLFNLAVVRTNPRAVAAASGVTVTGYSIGSFVGPLAFGGIVSHFGYSAAWWACSASLCVAAALVHVSRRRLARPNEGDA